MIITLQDTDVKNSSLQVGDLIYYAVLGSNGLQNTNEPIFHGTVTAIGSNSITTDSDNVVPIQSFLMFMKSDEVNNIGLKGYYAEVEMRNNSSENAELFAISSEVVESSK